MQALRTRRRHLGPILGALKVGKVEVYKVHHHCSPYSTNDRCIATLQPKVAVISTGDGNGYHRPAKKCVERLHAAKADLYWTEKGAGATPNPKLDHVWKNSFWFVRVTEGAGSSKTQSVQTKWTGSFGQMKVLPANLR